MRNRTVAATGILSVFVVCVIGRLDRAQADSAQPAATQPVAATMPATTTAASITWDQASKHVGETVTVTGPVAGTHVTSNKTSLILNVGKDYPDRTRFTVMIETDDKNKAAPATYQGKTISVTGKIEMYRNVPEIKANVADVTIAQ